MFFVRGGCQFIFAGPALLRGNLTLSLGRFALRIKGGPSLVHRHYIADP
ncbi:hypothetical protein MELE44368_14290 [Mycolicibacterium elephantis DSM 44368]|uniref:Uncharacterized protein n=1 Tax=Mycolicibacterium elephantis DSM 44368 TaxID=1335622 RepID=A0A439DX03_9MYCO|nr:hypothetical protein MELE44368_14290 [Mycolicibacterium elephantis DSM 44368]